MTESRTVQTVQVMARPSPLRQGRIYVDVPFGQTVGELIKSAGVDATGPHEVQAFLDGTLVPRDKWHCVKPKAGRQLVVHCIPRGGKVGKGILAIIFGIGLALLGGFAALAAIGPLAGASGLSIGATIAAGVISVGSGIYSLAAPAPRTPFDGDIPTSDESPALTGRGNTIRPFEPIARQFGRWRRFPTYAAKPYTETVGSDQFLRLLFSFGYGPLELSELKIGETNIAEITTDYQILPGYDDDPDLIYYTQSVDETPLAVAMVVGDPATLRTGELDTHEGSIDLVFPGGLIAFDEEDGDPGTVVAKFTIEYRETGSGDPWTGITATTPLGPGVYNPSPGDVRVRGKVRGLTTRGVHWLFPAPGQYDVRVARVTGSVVGVSPGAEGTIDDCVWSKLRSIRPGTKPRIPNLCLVEMRILATDKLGGVIEDFNALAESVLPIWSDAEPLNDGWGADNLLSTNASLAATRNHAWAFCHVLRGNGAQKRIPDSKLDMDSIAAWAAGINAAGRTFDAVFDFEATVQEVLRDIAGAARAVPTIVDGKYGVAVDEVKSTIVTAFSSRDTSNFNAARVFRDPLHAMRVQWVDPDAGYQPDEMIVYNDGYDESTSTEFGRIDLFGMTDSDQAWRDGRYHLAAPQLRPTVYSFDIDVAGLSLVQGDRFKFHHNVIKVGLATGRLTHVFFLGALFIGGTLDEEIPYSPEHEWGITIRLANGDLVSEKIKILPAPSPQFVMSTGVITPLAPAVGDLCMVGEYGLETADYICTSVSPTQDLGARIECIDYSPAIFTVDTEAIPPRDTTISTTTPRPLQVPGVPVVEGVVSDETVLIVQLDGSIVPQIVMTLSQTQGPVAAEFWQAQAQIIHDDGSLGEWIAAPPADARRPFVELPGVDAGATYNLRVRSSSADGRASAWVSYPSHLVIGPNTPPPDVQNLRAERGSLAVWDYLNPPRDFAGFLVRHQAGSDANWATAIPAHDGYLTVSEFDLSALPSGTRTVLVKAIDRARNQSVTAAYIVKDIGGAASLNVVETEDFHAGGFPGTITNGTVEGGSGDLVADDDATGFWTNDANTFWTGDANLFWAQPSLQMIYEDSWAVPGTAVPGRLVLNMGVTAGAWSVFYRINPSTTWLRWPGSVDVLASATYEFRVVTEASASESRITAFAALIDLPDLDEYLEDVTVAASGTVRLTLTKTFKVIKQVIPTLQQDGNGGIGHQVIDKSATLGPSVEVYDDTGTRVQGLVDYHVRGY